MGQHGWQKAQQEKSQTYGQRASSTGARGQGKADEGCAENRLSDSAAIGDTVLPKAKVKDEAT